MKCKKYLLKMTDYFFTERVYHKKLGKETGSIYHIAMDGSLKICANSLYGFLGAQGLNFNYPDGASEVTRRGREILEKTILWATNKEYSVWNPKETEEEESDE
jgi:DNA polymerase elongation subunit (family B)